jgi:hypothetical protein
VQTLFQIVPMHAATASGYCLTASSDMLCVACCAMLLLLLLCRSAPGGAAAGVLVLAQLYGATRIEARLARYLQVWRSIQQLLLLLLCYICLLALVQDGSIVTSATPLWQCTAD